MTYPITYEARRYGKLEMLVVAQSKGKFSVYRPNGIEETEEDSPGSKNIFDDPKIGVGYMGIGNIMTEGIDQPKITESASAELISSLIKEIQKGNENLA